MDRRWKRLCDSTLGGAAKTGAMVLIFVLVLSSTAAARKKVARDIDQQSPDKVSVIVRYADGPNKKHQKHAANHGAIHARDLALIKASVMSLPANQIRGLVKEDKGILYVSPDRTLTGAASYTTGFVAVNADVAQSYGYDGNGIGVAVIDSGISASHPDLQGAVVYAKDFTGQGTTEDLYGHGTHVAGLLAGNGSQSNCYRCFVTIKGVAPGVRLLNLRVLDGTGAGTDSAVISAIQAAISLKNTYNVRVINLSLGRGIYESYTIDPLTQAVEQAWKAGIIVVVAAGNYGRDNSNENNGYGTITSPGNDPYVITVGATNVMGTGTPVDDAIASYSSKGPSMLDHVVKPDIVAPGNTRTALLAQNAALARMYPSTLLPLRAYMSTWSGGYSPYYFTLSGTSMAAPMVSGAAALLFDKDPNLTPDQVKARLMKTANKNLPRFTSATDSTTGITYQAQADIFTVGAGELDIAAALNNTDAASAAAGVALSPTASYDPATGWVVLVNGNSVLWGSSVLWGTSVVWGESVIWGATTQGQSVLWGSSVVWGTNANLGFSVLWGTSTAPMSVVWGTSDSTSDAASILTKGDQ